ncbi:hypothetical protein MKZ38_007081 [Zalerion maritima]|uniref:RRM domain-containing protein n=1 Tax=Zalerion maritima TaxID=339359 RepID=A0AAD5RIW3_9PEZI|nr:hypothetical protein MKZ38_007081 [Zalerion maritima]
MSSSPEPTPKKSKKSKDSKDSSSKKRKTLNEIEVDLSLPEPPSKKAKRALRRGKPLPHSENDDSDTNSKSKADGDKTAASAEGKKRSEHSVWIGNLSFATTKDSLSKFLVENSGGSITEDNITRIKLPVKKSATKGQEGVHSSRQDRMGNKGFAYVDVDGEGAMYAAIGLSESELEGRKLLIKDATNFEGRPAVKKEDASTKEGEGEVGADGRAVNSREGKMEEKGTGSKKIFVGNLPYQVTDDILRDNFEKCGEINWVKVATFEDSGKCKGYGWVSFREEEDAKNAVKGFTRVPEEELDVEDFEDKASEDDAGHGGEGEDGDEKKPKKVKMRKWWVNRIMGRDLKIEMAEDDQTRYQKRFKKGGKGGPRREDGENGDRKNRRKNNTAFAEDKVYAEDGDGYRTGGIVEAKGTKVTFD